MKKLSLISLIPGFYLAMIFYSCKKLVTVGLPEDQLTTEAVYDSDRSAVSAITGLYSQMMQTNLLFSSNALTVYTAMSSDEINNTVSGSNDEFSKNALQAANGVVQNNIWSFGYKYIYHSNAILEGLSKSVTISQPVRDQLIGEAKFIRAFCHFYLVNLFGEIPLITSTDYRINSFLPRASIDEVYNQIITDLEDAQDLLSISYPSPNRTRPNKWTAKVLLARVYLYRQNPAKAEAICSEIIQSGSFSLALNPNSVFLSNSNETIWQLAPVQPNNNTWEGNLFIANAGIVPPYVLTTFLLNAFEPNDARKTNWVRSNVVNGVTYNYPYKYKVKTASAVTEMYIVFRLAEVYLIRAEARALLDNLIDSRSDLNTLRIRAGLATTAAISKPDILSAIQKERQLELFVEWGHRWLDLKRTDRINSIMVVAKPNDWNLTDALYPIPQIEIDRNPLLTQNPGY